MSNTDSVTAFLDEGGIFGGSIQNNDNLDSEYSLSSYDIPQNLAIGYGVDLPFGHGKQFLGDAQGMLSGDRFRVAGQWNYHNPERSPNRPVAVLRRVGS